MAGGAERIQLVPLVVTYALVVTSSGHPTTAAVAVAVVPPPLLAPPPQFWHPYCLSSMEGRSAALQWVC
jgi:hypothetical protein